MNRLRSRDELLTASEIARFVYCRRAWAYDKQIIRSRRWWSRWRVLLFLIVGFAILVLVGLALMGWL